MNRDKLFTITGAILGSIIEEGLEEVFPGLGELTYEGELSGAVAGLIGSEFSEMETENAMNSFVKFAYRKVNSEEAPKEISDDEVELFAKKFEELPKSTKKEIINSFKTVDPYAYSFIINFLKTL